MPSPPRSRRRALGCLYAGHRPVPGTTAATMIVDAVRNGDRRVVVGQDAAAVDERAQADPWTAYD